LLRVLEEKVIERVGDNQPIPVDVRIITATNSNLKELVEKGLFRGDLYYRINVLPIELAPLRKRPEDIPLLAESFFCHLQLKSNKKIIGISPEAMRALVRHPWPGNVRELKSAFAYAFVTCTEGHIEPSHLPPDLTQATSPLPALIPDDEQKKQELLQALTQARGNKSMAAKILGVSRVTVWNRIHRYNLLSRN
jgi:transcriptional regulator with PAS, ATPase and Fis domain